MESRISPSNALKVDADRLWATIDWSAKIGRFKKPGANSVLYGGQ